MGMTGPTPWWLYLAELSYCRVVFMLLGPHFMPTDCHFNLWAWKPDTVLVKFHVKHKHTEVKQPVVYTSWVDLKGIMLRAKTIARATLYSS